MSAAPEIVRPVPAPAAPARLPAAPAPVDAPPVAQQLAARLRNEWLPRAAWTISRTGRPGLIGIALLLMTTLFFFSTHLNVAAEVESLRADLAAAQLPARTAAADKAAADPAFALRSLPARTDMPAILRQLFNKATAARLTVDTGKYDVNAAGSGGVVRYLIVFPVTGPYPQIRSFIDATLATMPELGLSDLVIDRKAIADATVDAQIRMTVYTAAAGAEVPLVPKRETPPLAAAADVALAHARAEAQVHAARTRAASERVVAATRAASLFAPHSWYVAPPPPPPTPPPPPPAPTAPPFPYTFIGSFTPDGHPPVYFLSRADHVIDARVGDKLDGVYLFESASAAQLVFVYLPLDTRQFLAVGAPQ